MKTTDSVAIDDVTDHSWFESLLFEMSSQFKYVPADEIDSIIQDTLHLICDRFGLDRATLWQGEPGGMLKLTHIHEQSRALRQAPEAHLLSNPDWLQNSRDAPPAYAGMEAGAFFPWILRQVKRGLTVVIPMLDSLPPEAALDRQILQRYGTRSSVVVPLHPSPERLGCLTLACVHAERYWSPLLIHRFELVAHLIAEALARKSSLWVQRENDARMEAILNAAAEGIFTINEEGVIESANLSAERLFGYGKEELIGSNISILMPEPQRHEHDQHIAGYLRSGRARVNGAPRETLGRRKDGAHFPIELSVSEIKLENRRLFTGFVHDITARKEAEETLRESELRFRTIADSAPVLIWMSDPDRSWHFFNQPWLAFTGRTMEQESGRGWLADIHPDDRQAFLESFNEACDARKPFVLQCRLCRKDGEYRWFVVSGVPRFTPQGAFSGYIGSCTDITEQKAVEKAAQDLNGLLIQAHEDERALLARELHDDITQRLAGLAIDVGRFKQTAALDEVHGDLIRGVRQRLVRLSQDVHALSYELHPSALIHLGLEQALQSECEQFARRESVAAEVKLRRLPKAIPRQITIGLFRIAQEGLRNAVRHGRATRIEVSLWGVDAGLQLAVHDNGCGFDPARSPKRLSLGLASMRERARLLNGVIDIESQPGHGTTIVVWVPFTENTS